MTSARVNVELQISTIAVSSKKQINIAFICSHKTT